MGRINVLKKEVSELIAAGEVIERPASIVKELIENAIDASADAITLEIHRGGISYIRVTDNGIGIQKEDVKTAFLRHATSKVSSVDDLESIGTLGFRGEALASIAAVSKVEMITKTKDDSFATKIILSGGDTVSIDEIGAPQGTTIIVRDLFFNVPARLKFLKKDVSEGNAISSIIDKIALSHPEVSFKYINEDKLKMHTPGNGDLHDAIYAVFGREFSNNMLPVDYELNGVKVTGYISNTRASRANRSMQNFFVNNRYVKSKTCMIALEEGYKNAIMVGKYPYCVLNVSLKNDMVDVNVHPAKIEVRFVNEKMVFDAVYFAVKSALNAYDDILKLDSIKKSSADNQALLSKFQNTESTQTSINTNVFTKTKAETEVSVKKDDSSYESSIYTPAYKSKVSDVKVASSQVSYNVNNENKYKYINTENLNTAYDKIIVDTDTGEVIEQYQKIAKSSIKQEIEQEKFAESINKTDDIIIDKPVINFKIIGELFKTYLLFEGDNQLYMLDKHAAHERILFEKLKVSVDTSQRQVLLKPVIVSATPEEREALFDNIAEMEKLGFMFEDFGNNSVILREVPLVLSDYNANDIFVNIIQNIMDNKKNIHSDIFEDLLHSIACRCAIKAHDDSSIEELTMLLKTVLENDEIRHCPHGRPVVISIKQSEIEKKFGRI